MSKVVDRRPRVDWKAAASTVIWVALPSMIPESRTVRALPEPFLSRTSVFDSHVKPYALASEARLYPAVHVLCGLAAEVENAGLSSTVARYGWPDSSNTSL